MILVANPFQHLFHLANNRLGGHNLNLTTKAKYPAKELWADSNRDFYFKMLIINLIDHHIRTKLVNHSVHHAMKEAKPDSFHLAIIHVGLETSNSLRNNVAYIQNWLRVLKDDKRFIVNASGKAEKAVNLILGSVG